MTWFPDLGKKSLIWSGDHVRAIGWLHPAHPYTTGTVRDMFLVKLTAFAKLSGESTEALGWPVSAGFHTCEFCGHARGHRNFGVPAGKLLYVVPELIVHYIGQHAYAPPAEFIEAVNISPLPNTSEYRDSVASFRI
jgi:hypothetical protein